MNWFIKANIVIYCIFIPTACSLLGVFSKHIDPELLPYTESYYSLLKEHCISNNYSHSSKYQVYFKDLEWPAVGSCGRRFNGYIIQIDPQYWSKLNYIDKKQLMFHELAHCVIGQDHTTDINNYMYYSMRDISEKTLINQVISDIQQHCEEE